MKGDKQCLTLTDDFNELILNKKVLHLVSYSVKKKGCIDEKKLRSSIKCHDSQATNPF